MPKTERLHHLYTEATLPVSRHPILSGLRKFLTGRACRLHHTHLIGEARVFSRDKPEVSMSADAQGRVTMLFTWPGKEGGQTQAMTVRERGSGRYFRADEDHAFNAVERAKAAETTGPVDVALPSRVAAMFAEGVVGPFDPAAPAPPTDSTSVLHDLQFVADQLETAQFQIAFTPGGADAGSVDNAAHVALLAVQLVQAKLLVTAAALGDARRTLAPALAQLPSLNPAALQLDVAAARLPEPPESPRVHF